MCLQGSLISSVRREKLSALRWKEVDFQWRNLQDRNQPRNSLTDPSARHLNGARFPLPSWHRFRGTSRQRWLRNTIDDRPLDMLRIWHDKIETWLLDQAGIDFQPAQAPGPNDN